MKKTIVVLATLIISCGTSPTIDSNDIPKQYFLSISGVRISAKLNGRIDSAQVMPKEIDSVRFYYSPYANPPVTLDSILFPNDYNPITLSENGTAGFGRFAGLASVLGDSLLLRFASKVPCGVTNLYNGQNLAILPIYFCDTFVLKKSNDAFIAYAVFLREFKHDSLKNVSFNFVSAIDSTIDSMYLRPLLNVDTALVCTPHLVCFRYTVLYDSICYWKLRLDYH